MSDANKPHVLPEGDTRALDACAVVLGWGTPGCPADGGGGHWSPLMVRLISGGADAPNNVCRPYSTATCLFALQVRRGQERVSEALFQLR